MDGRRCLVEANREQWPPEKLCRLMARHVPKLFFPYLRTEAGKERPLLAPGASPGSKRLVLLTDPDVSKALRVSQSVSFRERDGSALLREAFRAGFDGLVINPGDPSRRVFDRDEMLLLFREYAVAEGMRLGGGWVPTRGDSMLLVELEDGNHTVTVYIDEADAREICAACGGEPVLHPWDVIGDRCLQVGAEAPYIQFGFPEQIRLLARHMDQLREEGHRESLRRLERAVVKGQGWSNAWEIIRIMSTIEKIWIIVDPEGDPIFFSREGNSPIADFFTSRNHALRLIEAFRRKGIELPGIAPRLVDARPLFEKLAPQRPIVWINRGSPEGWTSISHHLLPAVLDVNVVELRSNRDRGDEGAG